jgi:hypothetical protein
MKADMLDMQIPASIDLLYYDAFSPDKQPELWSEAIFEKLNDQCFHEECSIPILLKEMPGENFGLPDSLWKNFRVRPEKRTFCEVLNNLNFLQ